jgi:flagellar biosynthetic protein FliR
MDIAFNESWMLSTVLLWVRVGTLFYMSPWARALKAPAIFTVLLTFVLSGFLTITTGARAAFPLDQPSVLVLAILAEVLTGALLGLAVQCVFAAFSMAGGLLDVQMGFGMGAVFNPVTQSHSPVLGSVLALFGVAFFFAVDGHHAVMRGLAFSVTQVSPGTPWFLVSPEVILRPVGAMFTTVLLLVAPVFMVLLLMEMALAVASRALPQMNVFFVGMPAKILAGLAVMALMVPLMSSVMTRAYGQIFSFWDGVLR